MEDIIMNTIRIRACNEFVIGVYRNKSQIVRANTLTDKQIFGAVGANNTFAVRDWFGGCETAKFTIKRIEKDEYGRYIYTIECDNKDVNDKYFPSPYEIINGNPNVASPISYSIINT